VIAENPRPTLRRRLALAALSLPLALAAAACSEADRPTPPAVSTSRNNAVLAASGTPAPPAKAASGAPAATAKAAPRDVCAGQKERPGPKGSFKTKSAAGAGDLPATIAFGAGKWVWLNFWAAWCGPCKEEMPRLLAWQDKLRKAGVLIDLAFVSLDDDERQLERFLEGQPAAGVRASYWLPEGGTRTSFLSSLSLKDTPELPVQALVSPNGQLACLVQGAVEDRDYEALATFVGARK
jgi:thiol-disulfide isomerase/thioredoxin